MRKEIGNPGSTSTAPLAESDAAFTVPDAASAPPIKRSSRRPGKHKVAQAVRVAGVLAALTVGVTEMAACDHPQGNSGEPTICLYPTTTPHGEMSYALTGRAYELTRPARQPAGQAATTLAADQRGNQSLYVAPADCSVPTSPPGTDTTPTATSIETPAHTTESPFNAQETQAISDWLTQNPHAAFIKAEKANTNVRIIMNQKWAPGSKITHFTIDDVVGFNLGGTLVTDAAGTKHAVLIFATYDDAGKPIVELYDSADPKTGQTIFFGTENPTNFGDADTVFGPGDTSTVNPEGVVAWLNKYSAIAQGEPSFGRADTVMTKGGQAFALASGANQVGRIGTLNSLATLDLKAFVSNSNRGQFWANDQSINTASVTNP